MDERTKDTIVDLFNGQKIIRAPFDRIAIQVLEALEKQKRVGKKEFHDFRVAAQRYCERHRYTLSASFNHLKGTSKRPKMSEFETLSMAATLDSTVTERQDKPVVGDPQVSPYYLSWLMQPTLILRETKQFPVSFLHEHIDERLHTRANTHLDFSDESLSESLKFAMAFLYVLAPELKNKNIDMLPLVIPHREGLFLGHVESCLEHMFSGSFALAAVEDGELETHQGLHKLRNSDWLPKGRIYFKTFIGEKELKRSQQTVIDMWKRIIQRHSSTIQDIYELYTNTNENQTIHEQKWKALKADLLDLYRSNDWQSCIAYGMDNLPTETYVGMIERQLSELVVGFD